MTREGRGWLPKEGPKSSPVTCLTFSPHQASSWVFDSRTTLTLEVDVGQMAQGKSQLTDKHNTKTLKRTNNHGSGRMTVRPFGNVLNKEKMWSEDSFSSNRKVQCHT